MLRLPLLLRPSLHRLLQRPSLHTSPPSSSPMELKTLTQLLDKLAPLKAAESWDNVGLLVEPSDPAQIHTLLITNDLTEQVLQEALDTPGGRPGLIVAYHPPLFKPFKRLTQSSVRERVLVKAIEAGMAVYSPHTALDNMEGGINEWLLRGVGEGEVRALTLNTRPTRYRHVLEFAGDNETMESLAELAGADTKVQSSSGAVMVECTDEGVNKFLPKVRETFPSITFSMSSNTKVDFSPSGGKMLTLTRPLLLSEVVKRVKTHLKLSHIRLAHPYTPEEEDPVITTVAACAGSGGSVLEGVKADVLLTGEMSHHQVLAATGRGSAVILCEHTNTERGFLQGTYREWLQDAVKEKVQVNVAICDRDPLQIV